MTTSAPSRAYFQSQKTLAKSVVNLSLVQYHPNKTKLVKNHFCTLSYAVLAVCIELTLELCPGSTSQHSAGRRGRIQLL